MWTTGGAARRSKVAITYAQPYPQRMWAVFCVLYKPMTCLELLAPVVKISNTTTFARLHTRSFPR